MVKQSTAGLLLCEWGTGTRFCWETWKPWENEENYKHWGAQNDKLMFSYIEGLCCVCTCNATFRELHNEKPIIWGPRIKAWCLTSTRFSSLSPLTSSFTLFFRVSLIFPPTASLTLSRRNIWKISTDTSMLSSACAGLGLLEAFTIQNITHVCLAWDIMNNRIRTFAEILFDRKTTQLGINFSCFGVFFKQLLHQVWT